MEASRGKYKSLTLKEKLKAINDVNQGEKIKDVAANFGIKPNTLSTIYKNKENLRKQIFESPNAMKHRRIRNGKNPDLDKAVQAFVSQAREHHMPISGSVIQSKAIQLSSLLHIENFKASPGWLQGFKSRTGMKWKCLMGDSAKADQAIAFNWVSNVLQPLINQYDGNDIFNGDESALFFRCFPGKTMAFKGDKCLNGKNSKERITMMICSNLTGTNKIRPLVIGRSKTPRCFKNIKSLPVDYEFNKKAWMTGHLFEKWLMKLDDRFTEEKRNVLFICDNCSAHNKEVQQKLKSIRLEFFPPNLTSILQPMDQGIIRTIKVHYRKSLISKVLESIENQQPLLKISLLDCINNLSEIWDTKVTPLIIQNCFKRAGFCAFGWNDDEDDNISLLHWQEGVQHFEQLRSVSSVDIDSFEDYIEIDEKVLVGDSLSDKDIIASVRSDNKHPKTDIHSDSVIITGERSNKKISTSEVRESINTLRIALEQKEKTLSSFFINLNEIQEYLITK